MGSILLKLLNRLLDGAVLLTLLVTALYCVYCIWDNNTIYDAPLKLQQELRKQRPKEESPSFEELQRLNPDVAAWLTLEGTGIDDPIVQGEDNLEYLNKNVYGEYALAGSIFWIPGATGHFRAHTSWCMDIIWKSTECLGIWTGIWKRTLWKSIPREH